MRCISNSGRPYLSTGSGTTRKPEPQPVRPLDGNVVGGPLDGARIPNGTASGQMYVYDSASGRWRYSNVSAS
jgi:hypothetical protein